MTTYYSFLYVKRKYIAQFKHSNLEREGKMYGSVCDAVDDNCNVAVLISIVFALLKRNVEDAYDGDVLPPPPVRVGDVLPPPPVRVGDILPPRLGGAVG